MRRVAHWTDRVARAAVAGTAVVEGDNGHRTRSGRVPRASLGSACNEAHAGGARERRGEPVDLYEYQAKDLFAAHGVPVLPGRTVETPEEAAAAAAELGGTVVVKAQVKTGGRGKAGGVKLAELAGGGPGEGRGHPRDGHQGPHRAPGAGHRGQRHRRGVLLLVPARPRQPHVPGDVLGRGRHGDRAAGRRAARGAGAHPGRRDRRGGPGEGRRDRGRREDPGRGRGPGRGRHREAVGDLRRRGRHAGRGEPAGPRPAGQDRGAGRQGHPRRQRRLPPPGPRRPGRRARPRTRWRPRPRRRTSTTSSSTTARSGSSATAPGW